MNNDSVFNKIIRTPIPEHLYHYTTSKGLLGIIKEGKIWATKIQYLNDSSELNLGFKFIHEEIKYQLDNGPTIRTPQELEEISKRLDKIKTSYDATGGINLAVASFSKESNLLSQWRGYCKVGDGYSIGFYGNKLKEDITNKGYLLPCIYEEKLQRELIRELVNYCSLKNSAEDTSTIKINQMSFETAALIISPMIKDKAFKDEIEWRLIYKGAKKNPQFRSGNFSIIPYWEIELDLEKIIYQIVIGPTPLKEQSKNAVKTLVRMKLLHMFSRVDSVVNSEIPFGNI